MKVQLIVVQGKPEGKTIPLLGPRFKIGRGETCHLRPNSEQVSREHAEFVVSATEVTVADLGSRNGTLVNGRAITAAASLKDGDLVQVGPLTFAVSIQGMPAPAAVAAPAAPSKPAAAPKPGSLDDISNDDIDSWLISDKEKPTPESPSGVYGGDTITISAFKDSAQAPKAAAPAPAATPASGEDDEGFERLQEDDQIEDADESDDEGEDDGAEEFMDPDNPFYVAKKKAKEVPETPQKPVFKDTADAATEILRKMMERRKQNKES
jgi:predicted component of type VI protein secretion system